MAARSEDQCASPWTNTRPAALLLPPRLAPVSSVSLLLPLSVPAQRQRRRDRQRDSETMQERRRETGKGVERGGGGDGGTGCCPLRLAGCARQDQAPWKMEMWVGLLAQKRRISRWPGLTAQVVHSGLCQHREIERERLTDRQTDTCAGPRVGKAHASPARCSSCPTPTHFTGQVGKNFLKKERRESRRLLRAAQWRARRPRSQQGQRGQQGAVRQTGGRRSQFLKLLGAEGPWPNAGVKKKGAVR